MSILKNELEESYTRVPNSLIKDTTLSNGAFRVMCLLFSKPNNWNVFNKSIMNDLGIKKVDTLSAYWQECINRGWLSRDKINDSKDGVIGSYNYSLNLSPKMVGTPDYSVHQNGDYPKNGEHSNTNSLNNTNSKQTQTGKPSLVDAYALEDSALTELAKEVLYKFITYRKKIKAPIKTTAPLKAFITTLRNAVNLGYKYDDIINLMESKEWQTIKIDWIKKELTIIAEYPIDNGTNNIGGYKRW